MRPDRSLPKSPRSVLKADERNAVIAAAIFFMILYGLGWWGIGPVATVPALAVALGLLAALQLAGLRRLRAAVNQHLQQTQSLLFLQKQLNNEQPLPAFDSATLFPDAAATLAGLIRTRKPQLVLELGSGLSTLIAAYCLRDMGNGRLISLEHDALYSAISRDNLHRHGLQCIAEVVDAPLADVPVNQELRRWYDTRILNVIAGEVDLLIVDGPPHNVQPLARYPALPLLIDRLAADAVILVDDANRADEQEMVRRWQTEFPGFRLTYFPIGEGTILLERGRAAESKVGGLT
jgi:predicted O-methyltransferase YrrM